MKNEGSTLPAISAILVTPSDFNVIRESISHLQKQSAISMLEIVIVCPSKEKLNIDVNELNPFSYVEIIEIQDYESLGKCLAAGFLNANSPIVAFIEEHSYPDPQWAAVNLEAHKGDWAAVGWSMGNANPNSLLSWASLLNDFGPWVELDSSQEMKKLPPHHCSYKKEIILEFGEELGGLLEIETILHNKLKLSGRRLYFESNTRSAHKNIGKLSSYIFGEYIGGQLFSSSRMKNESWSLTKRLIHIAATPLIPFLSLRKVNREIRRMGRFQQLYPGIWPYLMMGRVMHALGELAGYLNIINDAAIKRLSTELERDKHLSE